LFRFDARRLSVKCRLSVMCRLPLGVADARVGARVPGDRVPVVAGRAALGETAAGVAAAEQDGGGRGGALVPRVVHLEHGPGAVLPLDGVLVGEEDDVPGGTGSPSGLRDVLGPGRGGDPALPEHS
jgi:hypothetical protein